MPALAAASLAWPCWPVWPLRELLWMLRPLLLCHLPPVPARVTFPPAVRAVQCRLAGLADHEPEWAALRRRELALLDEHGAGWSRPLTTDDVHLRRGFVERVHAAPYDLMRATELFAREPIETVEVGPVPG